MKTIIEIKSIEHKGIVVNMEINHLAKTVSLVDFRWNADVLEDYLTQNKQWVFRNRTVEYMDGWLNIMEAMMEAVKEAKKELLKIK